MLKKIMLCMFLVCVVTLTACSNNVRIQPRGTDALIKETWVKQLNTDPNVWVRNADPWFLTGESLQKRGDNTPLFVYKPPVSHFNSITALGDFQIQIVGGQPQNSVYIAGTQDGIDHISVSMKDNKLLLKQKDKPTTNMQNVIVRIGINNLRTLENLGNSLIMGRTLRSDKLRILSSGTGSILLDGNMNLKIVEQTGSGTITVLGANTQKLALTVKGNGNVNISGHIGIESILHNGDGTVNIIGADSDNLCINTAGNGLTTVYGYVDLKRALAENNSRVYVSWVFTKQLNVMTKGNAIIGVAGSSANLTVETFNNSCFLGQYLHAGTVYVSTSGHSHADVNAEQKIFATARNQSGILYYGQKAALTKFTYHQATILPVG